MFVRTFSAINQGLLVKKIEIEVDSVFGRPAFILIGLANKAVEESRERITLALSHCGVRIKPQKTVVNLAPADLKKTSSSLELAIAVALLKQYGQINLATDKSLFLGELSLEGELKPIKGILSIALAAKKLGFERIFFPAANLLELTLVKELDLLPLTSLNQFLLLARRHDFSSLRTSFARFQLKPSQKTPKKLIKFENIIGQGQAKRALTIAAAGGHHLLLFGEPGAGKSYLAQSILSILPALSEAELLLVNQIYSLTGRLQAGLLESRPFRAPHHSSSKAAILGGRDFPGEISLAHLGVLFLDELSEFRRDLVEALRQSLEEGFIRIRRAKLDLTYPARFTLIAAANPCPCGYYGSNQECHCNPSQLQRYQQKFSGPILDRIDLSLRIRPLENAEQILDDQMAKKQHRSGEIKKIVTACRQRQRERFFASPFLQNADLDLEGIKEFCQLSVSAKQTLFLAQKKLNLSTRAYLKLIKISQSIADLELNDKIEKRHLLEALAFRDLIRQN